MHNVINVLNLYFEFFYSFGIVHTRACTLLVRCPYVNLKDPNFYRDSASILKTKVVQLLVTWSFILSQETSPCIMVMVINANQQLISSQIDSWF